MLFFVLLSLLVNSVLVSSFSVCLINRTSFTSIFNFKRWIFHYLFLLPILSRLLSRFDSFVLNKRKSFSWSDFSPFPTLVSPCSKLVVHQAHISNCYEKPSSILSSCLSFVFTIMFMSISFLIENIMGKCQCVSHWMATVNALLSRLNGS